MWGVARVCAIALVCFAANPVFAATAFGTSTSYFFVSSTSLSDANGRPLAVCIEARTTRLAGLPLYRYAQQYVVSPIDCTGTEATPVPPSQVADGLPGVRRGVLREQPTLKARDLASGFWGWGIVPFLMLAFWVSRAFRKSDPAGRDELLVDVDTYAQRAAGVMGLVAGSEGRLTRQQLTQIRIILNDLTQHTFEQQAVTEMAMPAQEPLAQIPVDHLPDGLDPMQRAGLARAVATIAASSSRVTEAQQAFVDRVFEALDIPTHAERRSDSAMQGFVESTSPAE